jgi:hypothetical protein
MGERLIVGTSVKAEKERWSLNGVRAALKRHGWVLGVYVLLVVLATWPTLLHLQAEIIGREGDALVHLWNVHWVESALVDDLLGPGSFSFHTTRLFYPGGVSLLNHNIPWLHALLWMAIKPVVGGVPAYSLTVILTLVFNGFAGYLLARDVTDSVEVSVTAGAVMLLWPAILDHTNHPNLIALGFVAMVLRSLRRLLDRGRTRDVSALGLWLGLTAVMRLQMVAFGAFLWVPYAVVRIARMDVLEGWRRIKLGVVASALGAALSLPVTLPYLVYHLRARDLDRVVDAMVEAQSSDLLLYVLPRSGHWLFGDWVRTLVEDLALQSTPYSPALGWVTLGLAAVALVNLTRRSTGWGILAGGLLVLALGPRPDLFGFEIEIASYTRFYESWVLPVLREPNRFDLLLSVPVGLLTGWGMQGGLAHIESRSARRRWVLVGVALIFADLVALPHPRLSVAVPSWYASLVDDPENYGLLEIPTYRQSDERYMGYQLTHGKALVHGHVSRVPADAYAFIESVPMLAYLHETDGAHPPPGDFDLSRSLDLLNEADVRYVVIHKDEMSQGKVAQWRAWFPYAPYHEDARLLVYGTAWREALAAVGGARRLADGVDVLDLAFGPESTVPGGWVEVEGVWHVAAGAAGQLEVALARLEDGGVTPLPAVSLRGAGSGSRDDVLLRRGYPVQIPSETAPGAYRLCLGRSPQAASPTDREGGACYGLTVQARTRRFTPPPTEHAREVTFGERVTLIGFSSDLGATDLRLRLVWQAVGEMATSYKVFLHVVDARTGALAAQRDFVPQSWAYPTTYWQVGEYVEDEVTLDLIDRSPGSYEVKVGLYDPATGERLTTDPPSPDDAVTLMAFER